MKLIFFTISRVLLIFSGILLTHSCAINPVTGKKQLMLISESQEIAMGAQYDPKIVSSFGLYNDEELLKLITEKGEEIGRLSHRPHLKYHFRVLDSPVINAFAVPGGYIYITRGILAQFNNEAELMGVLAHEIGHVTARHSAQQMTNQQLAQFGVAVGMIASEEFRQFANMASQGLQLLFLKFSRDNERESDRLGVEYASKIGYDTHKMADFFNVLKRMQLENSHAGIPTFMSTHPDPGDRYTTVNKLTDVWQDSLKTSPWRVNQDNFLKMIDGIVYGDDPRQGFVEGNMFYHPELKFQYPIPGGWKLSNSPLQVQISPEDGKSLIVFTMAKQKELDIAASETLQQLNLTILNSNRTTVNGMPALGILSQQVNQNQQTGEKSALKVLSYFINYNGAIYVFHGVSNAIDFDTNFKLFESTMVSFNKLTDPRKINIEPQRIKIKQVQRTGTVTELLKSFGVPQTNLKKIALLNNMELSSRVSKGTLIKIIQ
jgi:predicted Zn-dependent protease